MSSDNIASVIESYTNLLKFDPDINSEITKEEYYKLCLAAVNKEPRYVLNYINFKQLDKQQINNIYKTAVTLKIDAYNHIPLRYRTEEIMLIILKVSINFKIIPLEKKTPEFCFKAISINSGIIEYMSDDERTPDLCLAAVENEPYMLCHLKENQKTLEVCNKAIDKWSSNSGDILKYIPTVYLTEEFIMAMLEKQPAMYSQIRSTLMTPKIAMRIAPLQNGTNRIPASLMSTEVITTLINKNPRNITHLNKEQRTFEICKLALEKDPSLSYYCGDPWLALMESHKLQQTQIDQLVERCTKLEEILNKPKERKCTDISKILAGKRLITDYTLFNLTQEKLVKLAGTYRDVSTWKYIVEHTKDLTNIVYASIWRDCIRDALSSQDQREAFTKRDFRMLKLFIKLNMYRSYPDNNNDYFLHIATKNRDLKMIKVLIDETGRYDIANNLGQLPLHILCDTSDDGDEVKEIADILVKYYKHKLNKRDNEGLTPLHYAVFNSNMWLIDMLLKNGADVGILDKKNRSVIQLVCDTEITPADNKVRIDMLELLLSYKVDPNTKFVNEDSTYSFPLHIACMENNMVMVKLLLEFGADKMCIDSKVRTPVFYAVKNDNMDLVRLLI
jgi:ankyrin repeat protein